VSVSVPDSGVYAFVFHLTAPQTLAFGSLGEHALEPGWLVFVGALSRGIPARLQRHASYDKKPRWHVDRITQCEAALPAWAAVFPGLSDDGPANQRLAAALRMTPAVAEYTAADGQTRLWWRRSPPSLGAMGAALGQMPVVVRDFSALDGQ
jgi:Uri superfamily endonuclease